MSLYYFSKAQIERMKPYFPLSHGVPRVDDRRVLSGIAYVLKNGLRWCDAPTDYGPHKTLYNRFIRWSRPGVFNRIFAELAMDADIPEQLQIDATHLKAHRTVASLLKKGFLPEGDVSRCIGRTKGGLNSKLHAVCDGEGRPRLMCLTAGQVNDCKGADLLVDRLPAARYLLADKGYDADWFREALYQKGITPCIPPRKNRKQHIDYDKSLYKQRHKVENMFGRIRLATHRNTV